MPIRRTVLAATTACILAGCGTKGDNPSDLVAATGKVVLPNGQAAANALVDFQPVPGQGGAYASGSIDGKDGTFKIKSLGSEGIAPGKYKVVVKPKPAGGEAARRAIPAKYHDESTTDLIITVAAGDSGVELRLR